jgi:hypothetical protein
MASRYLHIVLKTVATVHSSKSRDHVSLYLWVFCIGSPVEKGKDRTNIFTLIKFSVTIVLLFFTRNYRHIVIGVMSFSLLIKHRHIS